MPASAVPMYHGLRSIGLPARERHAAAGREVRMDVGERGRRLVEEHHAELAHDDVERAGTGVVDLHVGDAERHVVDAGFGGALDRELGELRGDVGADRGSRRADGSCGCDGRLAAAAPDVEHPFAGLQRERVEEERRDRVGEALPLGPRP